MIRIRSFSKDLLLAGVRIGYILASEDIIQRLSNRYMFSDGNAPVIVNAAIKRFLADPIPVLSGIKVYCEERKKHSINILDRMGLFDTVVKPEACYYLLAKAKPSMGSWEVFTRLLDNGLNIVPGVLFGLPKHEAWLRICFARDIETLDIGLAKIASTFQENDEI